jgi:hypothetical protein
MDNRLKSDINVFVALVGDVVNSRSYVNQERMLRRVQDGLQSVNKHVSAQQPQWTTSTVGSPSGFSSKLVRRTWLRNSTLHNRPSLRANGTTDPQRS